MPAKRLTHAVLSDLGIAVLTLFLALPWFATFESIVFPIVSKMQFVQSKPVEEGLEVYVQFEKYRSCEFIGITFKQGYDRIRVDFPAEDENQPKSRPKGEWVTGPWVLHTGSLEGIEVVVEHRCHLLWPVFTQLYP
jgi:hypothetical protein